MALINISKGFKQSIREQCALVFGKKRYLFHIAVWLISLAYLGLDVFGDMSEGFRIGVEQGSRVNTVRAFTINDSETEAPFAIIAAISSVVAGVMVYFFLLLVIPYARYKRQRRYLWLGFIANCFLWITVILVAAIILGFKYSIAKDHVIKNDILVTILISAVFSGVIAGLFFSLYYFIDLYDQQKELNRYRLVLTEKMEAETNFLKTQINPHFLFNTLNNIYSLTMSRPGDAADITRQLKNLVAYMLPESSKEKVPLEGEMQFLQNYVNLEQLRNRQEQAEITMEIKGELGGKEIAPLLLVNFVENAFKHGVKAGITRAFVRISILVMNNRLSLELLNSKPSAESDPGKAIREDGGIGIRNVKRRLAILYPHRHKLRIVDGRSEYAVYLTIDL